ncbi:MAG: PEGA domain-containing protein [Candidatus Omnitrophota bacterium]
MSGEQKIRAVLFHLSVFIFIIGLPLILSSALGYKFNARIFKFTKTGLIAIKTQPSGAKIYLNGKLLNERTPASIQELLPGDYHIGLELEKHYSWASQVNVEAGRVTRLEKIILFPKRPNVKQINKGKISSFWLDEERKKLYYADQEARVIYSSDLDGENFKEIANLPEGFSSNIKCKVSYDKDKLLCFDPHKLAVISLKATDNGSERDSYFIIDYPDRRLIDIFWHSDNYHLVLITDRNIEVLEAKPQSAPVNLVNLNKKNIPIYYAPDTDTLYFSDSERAADGQMYDNVYKLELGNNIFYNLQNLMKPRANEKDQK